MLINYYKMNYPKEINSSYEKRMNPDGSVNSKYVDLLEEDKPIAGQKFVCVSFVSPDKILKQKEVFFFSGIPKEVGF